MNTLIEIAAWSAGLCLFFWFVLSPRVATRLYRARLFAKDLEPGAIQTLWSFDGVDHNELFFPSQDEKLLHAWFFQHPDQPQGQGRVFLYNIGRASDIARALPYVKVMLDAGASVFIYEYRGFGLSAGMPTIKGICEDGLAAYDFLTERLGYKSENIVLYGESLGAAVAAHVSARRKAAGLVLQSGFASLSRIGKEMVAALRVYPRWLFPRPRLDNREAVKSEHPPLLVLHGVKDDVIPVHHSRLIFESASGPKTLVHLPNSAHTNLHQSDRSGFVGALAQFLSELP